MKSIKPTRDLHKSTPDPFLSFDSHIKSMIKKNANYYQHLYDKSFLNTPAKMKIGDARKLPLKKESIDIIITSPPYVTSYEYADLHQLSLIWFNYTKNLTDFRKNFIGTKSKNSSVDTGSLIGQSIVEELRRVDKPLSSKVNNYFADMEMAIREMYRVIRPGGHASIIIGNTNLKGVEIRNAEVAHEQMLKAGFRPKKVIQRKIAFQMITPWRDSKDGRFTSKNNSNKKRAYQYEYIIVMQK
jgi:DNA modification methylase